MYFYNYRGRSLWKKALILAGISNNMHIANWHDFVMIGMLMYILEIHACSNPSPLTKTDIISDKICSENNNRNQGMVTKLNAIKGTGK